MINKIGVGNHSIFRYKIKYTLTVLVFSFILLKILLNSIDLTIESYTKFYHYEKNKIGYFISSINEYDVLNFWEISGFSTGYGFFAPNVSSNFIIRHKVNSESKDVYFKTSEHFKTKEGNLRFLMLNQLFIPLVDNNNNKLVKDYLTLILKKINEYEEKQFNNNDIKTMLFLYDYPNLNQIKDSNNIKLFKLMEIDE